MARGRIYPPFRQERRCAPNATKTPLKRVRQGGQCNVQAKKEEFGGGNGRKGTGERQSAAGGRRPSGMRSRAKASLPEASGAGRRALRERQGEVRGRAAWTGRSRHRSRPDGRDARTVDTLLKSARGAQSCRALRRCGRCGRRPRSGGCCARTLRRGEEGGHAENSGESVGVDVWGRCISIRLAAREQRGGAGEGPARQRGMPAARRNAPPGGRGV